MSKSVYVIMGYDPETNRSWPDAVFMDSAEAKEAAVIWTATGYRRKNIYTSFEVLLVAGKSYEQ